MVKKEIFNDIWFLYKKYSAIASEVEWDELLQQEKELLIKHNNDPFLKDMIYALNNELGRIDP